MNAKKLQNKKKLQYKISKLQKINFIADITCERNKNIKKKDLLQKNFICDKIYERSLKKSWSLKLLTLFN